MSPVSPVCPVSGVSGVPGVAGVYMPGVSGKNPYPKAKAAKEKVKAGAVMTTVAIETMTAAMAHGRTGEMADTATGEAAALPAAGTVEDVMAAGAREIPRATPGGRHQPTHGTAIVLSHR